MEKKTEPQDHHQHALLLKSPASILESKVLRGGEVPGGYLDQVCGT